MGQATSNLKTDIESTRKQLKELRDEIKVKMHLAGMDVKDAWNEMSEEAEKLSSEISHDTKEALEKVVKRFRAFSDSLGPKNGKATVDPRPHK